MGNTQTREQRPPPPPHPSTQSPPQNLYTAADGTVYTTRAIRTSHGNIFGRSGVREEPQDEAGLAQRRINRAERELRKKEEKEAARKRDRERSMQEESVDGGFLVTSGLYISDEDYSKTIVRQLMVERRLAPFFTGLEDHRENWAEHQLIAAVQGHDVPPADQPPGAIPHWGPADGPVPYAGDKSPPSPSQAPPVSNSPNVSGLSSSPSLASPGLLKSRTKTPASITIPSAGQSSPELHPLEISLPPQPTVNGQRLEVYLYKDPVECEICYRSFPPYCNRSRCCDKPICSECFVSIKRKDPHPIDRNDDGTPNTQSRPSEPQNPESELDLSDIDLVSEPAKCPFCKESEFGVTYEPPPVRSGLVHSNAQGRSMASVSFPSPPSSPPVAGRKRAASLPANASRVVTTDKIRPEWAKKLLQAKLNVAKRARAATALHQQAFLPGPSRSRLGIFRRGTSDSPGDSEEALGEGTPLDINQLIAAADRRMGAEGGGQIPGHLVGSRAYQLSVEAQYEEALERALRESIEDERRRAEKAEKERQEQEKRKAKEDKQKAKDDQKQRRASEKAARKASGSNSMLNFPRAMRSTTSVVSTDRRSSDSIDSGKGKKPDQGSFVNLAASASHTHLAAPSQNRSSSRPSTSSAASDARSSSQNSVGTRSQSQTNFGSLNAMVGRQGQQGGDGGKGPEKPPPATEEKGSDLSTFSQDMMSSMDNIMGSGEASNSPASAASNPEDSTPVSSVEPKRHEAELAENMVVARGVW